MSEQNPEEWITSVQAAEEKGISRQAIAKAIRNGRLPAQRLGRYYMIRRSDLDAWTPSPRGPKPDDEGRKGGLYSLAGCPL
jgi:excisionase family DNA binding protein